MAKLISGLPSLNLFAPDGPLGLGAVAELEAAAGGAEGERKVCCLCQFKRAAEAAWAGRAAQTLLLHCAAAAVPADPWLREAEKQECKSRALPPTTIGCP